MPVMRHPLAGPVDKAVVGPEPGCRIAKLRTVAAAEMAIVPLPHRGASGAMRMVVDDGPAPARVIALDTETAAPPPPQVNEPAGIETVSPAEAASILAWTSVALPSVVNTAPAAEGACAQRRAPQARSL